MEISITRGLVQLKRLEQRIEKKINVLNTFVSVEKISSKNVKEGAISKENYFKEAVAEYDSLQDLIRLRKEIKDAIVSSNSKTVVLIAGREYTVAQAIERKSSAIEFEQKIVNQMNRSLKQAFQRVGALNEKVELDAQKLFGTASDDKKSESNRIEMIKMYIESNSYEIVDPLDFKRERNHLEKDLNDFLSEVDQALSESNAVTMITISKNPIDIR